MYSKVLFCLATNKGTTSVLPTDCFISYILFYMFYNINNIAAVILLISHFDIILAEFPLAHFFQDNLGSESLPKKSVIVILL